MNRPSLNSERPCGDRAAAPVSGWSTEKVRAKHLEKLAIVYVRQSTFQQTIHHQESTRLQYSLDERAVALGWPRDRVEVIDEDQGMSGATAQGRPGFQRLVAEVGLDHVGIILGVEMSRLARSCKDWYQLLEVCALFGTLIGDLDGIYDPSHYNDRLLLGLKGQMSEAELHIIRQRSDEARMNKARRGELNFAQLTMGYVRRPSGEIVLDPDEQVRSVVQLIFRQFERCGTVGGVFRYLLEHRVQLPVRVHAGAARGDLEWHRLCRPTLMGVLHNPMYAGAYVYGRYPKDARLKKPGHPRSGRFTAKPESWLVLLKDRVPAYITWEQYEANQKQMTSNRNLAQARGAVRKGRALLTGLVWCGRCGRRMMTHYRSGTSSRPRYECREAWFKYGEPRCQSLVGHLLDQSVSEAVIQALAPAALELSLQVAQDLESEQAQLESLWTKKLERARYEVERARRQYNAVEPENRLVARTLEEEWEKALRAEREVQDQYRRSCDEHLAPLTDQAREEIRTLATDIPRIWNGAKTTNAERREILRQLVDKVVVTVHDDTEKVTAVIEWVGGSKTTISSQRPVATLKQLSYACDLIARVKDLRATGAVAEHIAAELTREGWLPPKQCGPFSAVTVRGLLSRAGLSPVRRSRQADDPCLGKHEWWVPVLAEQLQIPIHVLRQWAYRKKVRARQLDGKYGRWVIWADDGELRRLRDLGRASKLPPLPQSRPRS